MKNVYNLTCTFMFIFFLLIFKVKCDRVNLCLKYTNAENKEGVTKPHTFVDVSWKYGLPASSACVEDTVHYMLSVQGIHGFTHVFGTVSASCRLQRRLVK